MYEHAPTFKKIWLSGQVKCNVNYAYNIHFAEKSVLDATTEKFIFFEIVENSKTFMAKG
ncbi:MAG: hypothetical protein LC768_05530 [Acidobacteria bacterium]|nr:hypothetical protein [Acidobacteriota bacterium]